MNTAFAISKIKRDRVSECRRIRSSPRCLGSKRKEIGESRLSRTDSIGNCNWPPLAKIITLWGEGKRTWLMNGRKDVTYDGGKILLDGLSPREWFSLSVCSTHSLAHLSLITIFTRICPWCRVAKGFPDCDFWAIILLLRSPSRQRGVCTDS